MQPDEDMVGANNFIMVLIGRELASIYLSVRLEITTRWELRLQIMAAANILDE